MHISVRAHVFASVNMANKHWQLWHFTIPKPQTLVLRKLHTECLKNIFLWSKLIFQSTIEPNEDHLHRGWLRSVKKVKDVVIKTWTKGRCSAFKEDKVRFVLISLPKNILEICHQGAHSSPVSIENLHRSKGQMSHTIYPEIWRTWETPSIFQRMRVTAVQWEFVYLPVIWGRAEHGAWFTCPADIGSPLLLVLLLLQPEATALLAAFCWSLIMRTASEWTASHSWKATCFLTPGYEICGSV